ncbi:MAG: hypothetical protein COZ12_05950 [Deltaproteobacteria bacterium CG_4_10_14_3_um_filter_60_8]|nr:MAG: hypothetical protein AUK28_09085 [Desulfobacterales bacterium CG2_30_60_27]PIY21205.1 MAG: hypothetical protein COZ12_05950 [Deltaproteobacteria bacterium CG_4_10_14_3_um_filter_60_8]
MASVFWKVPDQPYFVVEGEDVSTQKSGAERRSSARFPVHEETLAIHANKPGRMLDIGKGGVAFEYRDGEAWPDGALTLDVLYGEQDFYLDMLPVKTVADGSSYSRNLGKAGKGSRRRSLQFGGLSAGQRHQLNYFLKLNANCKKASHRG